MSNSAWHVDLYNQILAYFSFDEVKELYFKLSLDADLYDQKTKRTSTNELIKECITTGRISALLDKIEEKRPQINWQPIREAFEAEPHPFGEPNANENHLSTDQFSSVLNRLDESNSLVKGMSKSVSLLGEALLKQIGAQKYTFAHPVPTPDSPPTAPEGYVFRTAVTQSLSVDLESNTLLAIIDSSGKGKTQTARELVAKVDRYKIWWITLTEGELHNHFREQLVRWLIELTNDLRYWEAFYNGYLTIDQVIVAIVAASNNECLLVIDNLPNSRINTKFYNDLQLLSQHFQSNNCKIIVTSQWTLPAHFRSDFSNTSCSLPNFGEFEVRQLLLAIDAPESFVVDGIIGLILSHTEGNPSLVRAFAGWLKRSGWQTNGSVFTDLLSGQPIEEVRKEKRGPLLGFLDNEPRNLLHRLTLINDSFDRGLALKIASVSQSLNFPGDALDQLTTPWLDKLENNKYRVSPIFKGAGTENLPNELQQRIHLTLADRLLKSGTIPITRIVNISSHLISAGEYDRCVNLFTVAMMSAATPEQAKYIDKITAISHYYFKTSWPESVDMSSRIMFRAAQVRLRMLMGGEWSELHANLLEMIENTSDEHEMAIVFALLNTGPLIVSEQPIPNGLVIVKNAIQSVRILRKTEFLNFTEAKYRYEDIIWLSIARIHDGSQLEEILEELKSLSGAEITSLFESEISLETASLFADRRWVIEADKPEEERQWEQALLFLNSLQEISLKFNQPILEVAAVRGQAIVYADYLSNADHALTLLDNLPVSNDKLQLSFLINYTRGCILQDNDRYDQALSALNTAIENISSSFVFSSFDAQRRRVALLGHMQNWHEAKTLCIKMIHRANDLGLGMERLEMMGELAFIHWSIGNRRRAVAALAGLIRGLVVYPDQTVPKWHEAFVKTGHALGWFSSIASSGRPPSTAQSGEPYAPVLPGLFALPRPQLRDFQPRFGLSSSHLLSSFCMLASEVKMSRLAWVELTKLKRGGDNPQYDPVLEFFNTEFASLTARYGDLETALTIGINSIQKTSVTQYRGLTPVDAIAFSSQNVDINHFWLQIPHISRIDYEKRLSNIVFGPAFSELIGTVLSDEEIETRLSNWEAVISELSEIFEDPNHWHMVIEFLKKLVVSNHSDYPSNDLVKNTDMILNILWHLLASTRLQIPLHQVISTQVSAVLPFNQNPALGSHMLEGLGRFLHRYWLGIAETRRFALNNPDLFRDSLVRIRSNKGAKTISKVLLAAIRAVGVIPPESIKEQIRALEQV